jgi:hypothetical protein
MPVFSSQYSRLRARRATATGTFTPASCSASWNSSRSSCPTGRKGQWTCPTDARSTNGDRSTRPPGAISIASSVTTAARGSRRSTRSAPQRRERFADRVLMSRSDQEGRPAAMTFRGWGGLHLVRVVAT